MHKHSLDSTFETAIAWWQFGLYGEVAQCLSANIIQMVPWLSTLREARDEQSKDAIGSVCIFYGKVCANFEGKGRNHATTSRRESRQK
jgi:hypothetical protein